jgi:hypothetical protein
MAINPVLNGAQNVATGQVTVATTATLVVTRRATRRSIGILNSGSNTIYLGGPTVTTTTGHQLPSGAFIGIPTTAEIWAIAATSSSVTFVEAYD